MDKPAWGVGIAVQTRPEQPEAPSLLVLDPIVIADRIDRTGAFRPPPFLGDPLRPIGVHHPIPAPPPDEAERRGVRAQPQPFRPAPTPPPAGPAPSFAPPPPSPPPTCGSGGPVGGVLWHH